MMADSRVTSRKSKKDYTLLQDEVLIEEFDISPLHTSHDTEEEEESKPRAKKTPLNYLQECCSFIAHVFPTTGSAFISLSRSFNNDLDLWRIIVDVRHFDIGRTRLSVAAFEGRVTRISKLLALGSNVNLPRKDSFTCLIMSSQNGHLEAVKELVKAGADMNAKSNSGVTSLMISAQNGHRDVVAFLLEQGALVDLSSDSGNTALMYATQHYEVMLVLLEMGADPSFRSTLGHTALMYSAQRKNLGGVRLLLRFGASANEESIDGFVALMGAARMHQAAICEVLLQAGGDVNAGALRRYTPLIACLTDLPHKTRLERLKAALTSSCLRSSHEEVTEYREKLDAIRTTVCVLIVGGGDRTVTNSAGLTPLQICSAAKIKELIQLLVD